MRVRRAKGGDFKEVTRLLEELGRDVVTPETEDSCREAYLAQVEDPEVGPLVVEDANGTVVGCCSLHFRPRLNRPAPDAWIPDLVVSADARRQGAGGAMLAEAERLARDRGCWQLTLESGYRRKEAHAMYEGFGMSNEGYYFSKPLR